MSMMRCDECGRQVDTDEDTEGVFGVLHLGDSTENVFICQRCAEKDEVVKKWGLWAYK